LDAFGKLRKSADTLLDGVAGDETSKSLRGRRRPREENRLFNRLLNSDRTLGFLFVQDSGEFGLAESSEALSRIPTTVLQCGSDLCDGRVPEIDGLFSRLVGILDLAKHIVVG
jgi:hypothetical protein